MRTVFNPAYVGFIQPPGPPQPNFYNLYGSTPVGASSVSNVGTFLSGVTFKVTAGSLYLNGYRYFIADGNQPTSAQPFALWQLIGGAATTSNDYLITGSTVTSGTLALGWNYVPLATPIPLGATVEYLAATGFTGNFAFLAGQFGSGDPHSAGITNGPLFAFSDIGGSANDPYNNPQGLFDTSTANPASRPPYQGSDSANFGTDVEITDQVPSGATFRLFPNQPYPVNQAPDTAFNFTLGTEFSLSRACVLNNIWFYSLPGTTQLPTACGIWQISSQTLVSGTSNLSPTWSGAAGSGWVSCSYASVPLAANTPYKTSVFNGAASPVVWNAHTDNYWQSPGFGQNGVTNGPISAPNACERLEPGQCSYHQGVRLSFTRIRCRRRRRPPTTGSTSRCPECSPAPNSSGHRRAAPRRRSSPVPRVRVRGSISSTPTATRSW